MWSICWSYTPKKFIEGIHIKRKVINFSLIICNRRICVTVKLCKLIYIVLNLLIISMEDMSSIQMNLNPFLFTGINITRDVMLFSLTFTFCLLRLRHDKHCTKKASTYNEIIAHLKLLWSSLSASFIRLENHSIAYLTSCL